ncbi:hypothetical protein [Fretibacter rubidus]|uniref:hypothetical protein n=1 Tax=Fretibacter rubidus TaxID=570162 RepID=UPI00352B9B94
MRYFGQIILAIVAVVVISITGGISGAVANFLGTSGALSSGVSATTSAALSSITSQAEGLATRIQYRFDFKAVGLSVLTAGVSGAGVGGAVARRLTSYTFGQVVIGGAVNNAAGQGLGIITGLQSKFTFAAVATAGVGAGSGHLVSQYGTASAINNAFVRSVPGRAGQQLGAVFGVTSISRADAIANAATRSAIDSSNFGDNICRPFQMSWGKRSAMHWAAWWTL